ncbi:MAG: hypothetical protein ACQESP_10610 [Candidatus Muiribacteriota bacterium]
MKKYNFPEYYDLLLEELYQKYGRKFRLNSEKLSKFRDTLNHSMGKGVEYTMERALLYSFYFLPVNFFKSLYILKQLDKKTDFFRREKISIVDLGCGPGSFFAALVFFINIRELKIKVDYTGLDCSEDNLYIFKKLFLNSDFKSFINFPLKTKLINRSFPDYSNLKKKDLIVAENIFTEFETFEKQSYFLKRAAHLAARKSESYIVFVEPVNRRKNKVFHQAVYDFLEKNRDYSELVPCISRKANKNCLKCSFFETVFFNDVKIFNKFDLSINDADFTFHILKNTPREQKVEFGDFPQNSDRDVSIKGWLCTNNIYRKPKPPWRYKICNGKNGIDFIDIIIKSEEHKNKLQNLNIGDIAQFSGKLKKDKNKKAKSRFILSVSKITFFSE